MTKDTMAETAALKALLSENADNQILAEMPGFVADRLMALDVDQLCGTGVHERSTGRVNHGNGYHERRWETRAGSVDVQIPTSIGQVSVDNEEASKFMKIGLLISETPALTVLLPSGPAAR